jgi:hypothetical protein
MKAQSYFLILALSLTTAHSALAEMTEVGALQAISRWEGAYAPNPNYTETEYLGVVRTDGDLISFRTPTGTEDGDFIDVRSDIREEDLARMLVDADLKTPSGLPLEIKVGRMALKIDRLSGKITGYNLVDAPLTPFQQWAASLFSSRPRAQRYFEALPVESSDNFRGRDFENEREWERYLDGKTLQEAHDLRRELARPSARAGRRAPVRARR